MEDGKTLEQYAAELERHRSDRRELRRLADEVLAYDDRLGGDEEVRHLYRDVLAAEVALYPQRPSGAPRGMPEVLVSTARRRRLR